MDFFGKRNYLLAGAGALTLGLGYLCLAQGPAENPVSLNVAPMLLVLGYLVVFPLAILWNGDKEEKK